jgi:hypothetical protein
MKSMTLSILGLMLALSASNAHATTRVNCVDLSFQTLAGSGLMQYRQIGCEKFDVNFVSSEGNVTDVSDSIISGDFVTTSGDTEYQIYTTTQRWMWSKDGKSLIHDSYSDVINKASLDKMYWTTSKVYSLDASGKVKLLVHEIFRVESIDGEVTVETETRESLYDALQ